MVAYTSIILSEGIVALFHDANGALLPDENDVAIEIADYGLNIIAGDMVIPVPAMLIEHLIQNGRITVFNKKPTQYISEPVVEINLPEKTLSEAKGAYELWLKLRVKK